MREFTLRSLLVCWEQKGGVAHKWGDGPGMSHLSVWSPEFCPTHYLPEASWCPVLQQFKLYPELEYAELPAFLLVQRGGTQQYPYCSACAWLNWIVVGGYSPPRTLLHFFVDRSSFLHFADCSGSKKNNWKLYWEFVINMIYCWEKVTSRKPTACSFVLSAWPS